MSAVIDQAEVRAADARSAAPRRLTSDELRRYEAQGCLVVPGVFPPEDLDVIDREIDRLLAERRLCRGGTAPSGRSSVRRTKLGQLIASEGRHLVDL